MDPYPECQDKVASITAAVQADINDLRTHMRFTISALNAVGDDKVAELLRGWEARLLNIHRKMKQIREEQNAASAAAALDAGRNVGAVLKLLLEATVAGSIDGVRERAVELGLRPEDYVGAVED